MKEIIKLFFLIFLFFNYFSCDRNEKKLPDKSLKSQNIYSENGLGNKTSSIKTLKTIEIYKGDFDKIKNKGVLRVLTLKTLFSYSIPMNLSLKKLEANYLKKFAKNENLK